MGENSGEDSGSDVNVDQLYDFRSDFNICDYLDEEDGSLDGEAQQMADYETCDPSVILNLFESLSMTTNSIELQIKINKHVSIEA